MKKELTVINILALILAITALSSCEKILEIAEEKDNTLVINAVATPDTTLTVSVSMVRSINSVPRQYQYLDYYDYYQHIDSIYYKSLVPENAKVTYSVNGGEQSGEMRYDAKSYNYVCDYRPKPGDDIYVKAEYTGISAVLRHAEGSVVVPSSQPGIELVSKLVYYDYCDKGFLDPIGKYDIYGADSIMAITLKLKDIPGEKNYYRIRVRGIADLDNIDGTIRYSVTDMFSSTDLLLTDRTLNAPFGNWPAYFTNIFDDHLFENGEYTLTVMSRMRSGKNPRVLVEYQSITPDYYYYLHSVYQYRIADNDALADPMGIHSNMTDGWGILGAATSSRLLIYY